MRINGGFPLSNRLIREVHAILLSTGRGSRKAPGEFRRSQNWLEAVRVKGDWERWVEFFKGDWE